MAEKPRSPGFETLAIHAGARELVRGRATVALAAPPVTGGTA